MISRTHIDASSLYHLGIILQSPFYRITSNYFRFWIFVYSMSNEHDLAESPATTAEGRQICSGSGSGSGKSGSGSGESGSGNTSAAAAVEVAAAEGAAATDWAIEGVGVLEGDALRHMNAFYVLLKDWFVQKNYTSVPCICLPCPEASSGIFKQYRCDEFEGSI
jgi:hypothetical protein